MKSVPLICCSVFQKEGRQVFLEAFLGLIFGKAALFADLGGGGKGIFTAAGELIQRGSGFQGIDLGKGFQEGDQAVHFAVFQSAVPVIGKEYRALVHDGGEFRCVEAGISPFSVCGMGSQFFLDSD